MGKTRNKSNTIYICVCVCVFSLNMTNKDSVWAAVFMRRARSSA